MAELDPREAQELLAAMPPGPQRDALQQALQEYQADTQAAQAAAAEADREARAAQKQRDAEAKAEAKRREAEAQAAAAERRAAREAEQAAETAALRGQALALGADLQRQVQRVPDPREAARLSRQVSAALQRATRATTPAAAQAALSELEAARQAIQTAQALGRREQRAATRQAVSQTLAGGHLLVPQGREARFIDALVTIVVAMGAVLWTASRNHSSGSDILWAIFWTLLGGVMAVEAKEGSELQYGGAGVAAANASYLALRLVGGIEPQVL